MHRCIGEHRDAERSRLIALLLLLLGGSLAAGCQSPDLVIEPAFLAGDLSPGVGPSRAIQIRAEDGRLRKGPMHEGLGEMIATIRTEPAVGGVYLQASCQQNLQTMLERAFTRGGFKVTPDAEIVVAAQLRSLELEAPQFTDSRWNPDTGSPLDLVRGVLPRPVLPTKTTLMATVAVSKGGRVVSYDFVQASDQKESSDRSVVSEVLSACLSRAARDCVRSSVEKIELAATLPISDQELAAREDGITSKQEAVANLQQELQTRLTDAKTERDRVAAFQSRVADEANRVDSDRAAVAKERREYEDRLAQLQTDRTRLAASKNEDAALRVQLQNELEAKAAELAAQAEEIQSRQSAVDRAHEDLHLRESTLKERLTALALSEEQQLANAMALEEQQQSARKQKADLTQWEERLKALEGELKRAAAVADAAAPREATKSPVPPQSLVAKEKPQIVIADPERTGDYTTLKQVTVRGMVMDNMAVASVQGFRWEGGKKLELESLLKADRSSTGARSAPAPRLSEPFAFLADLRQGSNRISIEAANSEGLQSEQSFSITQKEADGKTYLLAVGVNKFEQPDIPSLRYAAKDVERFVETLQPRRSGLPSENILQLLDQDATLKQVEEGIFDFLSSRARRNDTVIIYFSGHGVPAVDLKGQAETFLLPFDAQTASLARSALPVSLLAEALKGLPSERTILIADTCYSGRDGGRTLQVRESGTRSEPTDLGERLQGKGRIILSASKASEIAREEANLGHGVFTYFLVRGLEGEADVNDDKQVTVTELYDFVSRRVSEHTRGEQHPQLKRDNAIGEMVIARLQL